MRQMARDKAAVRSEGASTVIDLPARIDSSAEATLNEAYAEAARSSLKRLVLNFSGVDYLSSTGIALIVGILARSRTEGREVAAAALSDHYREIFEITRLSDFMRIYPDERAAIGGK